ncbi:hypothetical protein [Streptomyces sp. NPDC088261]|uniref:hypothetical protein n=1 Tax=Streptomyces sp. NPDC088261 TaxID=3365851 RepID=UPI003817C2B1
MTRFGTRTALLFSTALLIAGCGVLEQEGKGEGAAMDMQEAAERSDSMLDATMEAIRPAVRWAHDDTTSGSCDLSRRRTVMTIISEERRGSFLGVVERFWKKTGYEITSVDSSRKFPAIFAETSDGFQLALTIGDKGQAFFEVATPCVDRSDVAEPTTPPNGPAYEGVEIPYPNVHSDFWSAPPRQLNACAAPAAHAIPQVGPGLEPRVSGLGARALPIGVGGGGNPTSRPSPSRTRRDDFPCSACAAAW